MHFSNGCERLRKLPGGFFIKKDRPCKLPRRHGNSENALRIERWLSSKECKSICGARPAEAGAEPRRTCGRTEERRRLRPQRGRQDIVHCLHAAKALVSRLKREEDAAVREAILNSLVRLNDPSTPAAGRLSSQRGRRPAQRGHRDVQAIGLRSRARSADSAGRSRSGCADFRRQYPRFRAAPEAEAWLIEVIERDAQVNVCATAVDLLCEVGTEQAIDPLLRLKSRFQSEPYIQLPRSGAQRIREV